MTSYTGTPYGTPYGTGTPYGSAWPSYVQPYTQMQPMAQQQQTMPPSQRYDEGIVVLGGESEMLTYPVALGKSQLFYIAGTKRFWNKQMGKSLLEPPQYTPYKLVEDKASLAPSDTSQGADISGEIQRLWAEIDALKGAVAPQTKEESGNV